jgi:hypothetical protein
VPTGREMKLVRSESLNVSVGSGMVVSIERPLCRLRPVFCLCHSGKENGPESHLGSGATLISTNDRSSRLRKPPASTATGEHCQVKSM